MCWVAVVCVFALRTNQSTSIDCVNKASMREFIIIILIIYLLMRVCVWVRHFDGWLSTIDILSHSLSHINSRCYRRLSYTKVPFIRFTQSFYARASFIYTLHHRHHWCKREWVSGGDPWVWRMKESRQASKRELIIHFLWQSSFAVRGEMFDFVAQIAQIMTMVWWGEWEREREN